VLRALSVTLASWKLAASLALGRPRRKMADGKADRPGALSGTGKEK